MMHDLPDLTKAEQLQPPARYLKAAEHHWIEDIDSDGHLMQIVVLQWNPGAQRWSHSGYVGTGLYVCVGPKSKWLAHCPMPPMRPD